MPLILVVEDDKNLRSNICEILESEGFDVESAVNGKAGFEKAKRIIPDLILSDIMMPILDGYQLIQQLSEDTITSSIPVILLTAKVEAEDIRHGMNLGADDYLLKPFRINELLESVKTRLRKKENLELKMDKVKEEISEKIPHELRTPLVPIIGFSDMIEDETDIQEIKSMARMIAKSGGILKEKIEKFLILKDLILLTNNSGSNRFYPGLIEVNNELLEEILLEKYPRKNDLEKIKLNNIESQTLKIDKKYFVLIVSELVDNGLKFSDNDEPVIIKAYKNSDDYIFSVLNYGKGMHEYEIKSINAFTKFGEDHFRERGLGLGLEIVKKIVQLHSAKFEVKSNSGITNFEIAFPLNVSISNDI